LAWKYRGLAGRQGKKRALLADGQDLPGPQSKPAAWPGRDTYDIARHRGQLDIGAFQDLLHSVDGARLLSDQLRPMPS